MKPRTMFGALLLLTQLGFVIAARFHEARYFCWAPHDAQSEFRIRTRIGGSELDPDAVLARYGLTRWVDPRAISHVKHAIAQYETTYGRDEAARVVMKYRTNGGPLNRWRWPPS